MLITPEPNIEREIVIGLVAPLGADLDRLSDALVRELSKHDYKSDLIRLSSLLVDPKINSTRKSDRRKSQSEKLMDAGDKLRTDFGSGDAVAALGVAQIRQKRSQDSIEPGDQRRRHAWIVRTLKNTEEVSLLRYIYGSRFVLIGVNESESQRARNFEETLKFYDPLLPDISGEVAKLIRRDEKDPISKFGQQVRATNELSDFYVDIDSELIHDTKRIVNLLFGKPFETPTRDEQNMYHAFAASLRSADPGRQVGAVIATKDGDILATGSNEVPKPGGGQYWSGDSRDLRDFQIGRDYNKWQNRRSIQEVLDILNQQNFLSADLMSLNSQQRLERVFGEDQASSLKSKYDSDTEQSVSESRVGSLIEFGRITHAEMSAITDAARHGKATAGTTIYVTAFPCHMCMRLIIASGIERVVYVDPYPKSLAVEMYGKMLNFEGTTASGRIAISPFRGTSWRVFNRMFSMINRDRSKTGHFMSSSPASRTFRAPSGESLIISMEREALLVSKLIEVDNINHARSNPPRSVDDSIPQNSITIETVRDLDWLTGIVNQAKEEISGGNGKH